MIDKCGDEIKVGDVILYTMRNSTKAFMKFGKVKKINGTFALVRFIDDTWKEPYLQSKDSWIYFGERAVRVEHPPAFVLEMLND